MKSTAIITLEKGGEIRIEFYPEDAPKTVANFLALAWLRLFPWFGRCVYGINC